MAGGIRLSPGDALAVSWFAHQCNPVVPATEGRGLDPPVTAGYGKQAYFRLETTGHSRIRD